MRSSKSEAITNENQTEIIELAIGDLETLARVFNVIKEVCEQRTTGEISEAFDLSRVRTH